MIPRLPIRKWDIASVDAGEPRNPRAEVNSPSCLLLFVKLNSLPGDDDSSAEEGGGIHHCAWVYGMEGRTGKMR